MAPHACCLVIAPHISTLLPAHHQIVVSTSHSVSVSSREPTVCMLSQGKLRLDAYLTAQLPQSSRGKLQAAIKAGNVIVNGKPELKTSVAVRPGDAIQCTLLEAPVMQALPEVCLPQPFHFLDCIVHTSMFHCTNMLHSTSVL